MLYARDVQGRHGEGIDNRFRPSECSSSRDTRETTILFADVELNGGMNGVEEVLSEGSARVGVHESMFNVVYHDGVSIEVYLVLLSQMRCISM